ncbi:MAG: hypothetical protein IJS68_00045 [Clostridia bacterium]|nr:hypothetical protein [Clostridia bacterium]
MKKRNWLMTIAFAVLSLTIVSTMVIGSTYAMFTSKVAGNSSAEAAGFLIAGQIDTTAVTTLMAPGEAFYKDITINYFSQVPTKISEAGAASGMEGTGIFKTTVSGNTVTYDYWADIVDLYNDNVAKLAAATGATGTAVSGAIETSPESLIQVKAATRSGTPGNYTYTPTNTSFVEQFIAQVFTNLATKATVYGSGTLVCSGDTGVTYDDVIPAMLSTANAVQTADLSVAVTWVSDTNGGDLFDTFLGALITSFATGSPVTLGTGTNEVQLTFANGEADPNNGAIELPASAVDTTVGLNVGLKAEQVALSAYAGMSAYVAPQEP